MDGWMDERCRRAGCDDDACVWAVYVRMIKVVLREKQRRNDRERSGQPSDVEREGKESRKSTLFTRHMMAGPVGDAGGSVMSAIRVEAGRRWSARRSISGDESRWTAGWVARRALRHWRVIKRGSRVRPRLSTAAVCVGYRVTLVYDSDVCGMWWQTETLSPSSPRRGT